LIEKHGGDVNAQNNDNDTPLHHALDQFNPNDGDDVNVLTYLLSQNGVNGNIKGQRGYTILHMACKRINYCPLDVFKILIETVGCDANVQDDDTNTPPHYAVRCFDPNNDEYDEDGEDDKIPVLTYVLSQMKVNADIKGKDGYSLLHTACERINKLPFEIFKILIETHGADVNVKDNDNNTPLHHALDCFDPYYGGDIKALAYLIDQNNVNVNIKTPKGDTLLHLACQKINILSLDIFKVLIEKHGCDVNAQNKDKNTPLRDAIYCLDQDYDDDITALAYLINQTNIGVNTKYTDDFTLFHSACTINLSNTRYSAKQNAECDATLCQVVELIAERCVQEVFDEETPLEATTTM